MRERLRHLRQAQLCVGGEAYLQAEERGNDPESDDDSFAAGHAQVHVREGAAAFQCHIHVVLPYHHDGSHSVNVTAAPLGLITSAAFRPRVTVTGRDGGM